jgi:hypothetical protein
MKLRAALASLLLAALAAGASAGEPEGAAAPANAWLMDGGCAARTGRSLTRAIAGPVETAWEQTFKGEIEGEPLVVDAWVFVCVREAAARTLYVLDLGKGSIVGKKTFKTAAPLIPCLGPNVVVVRTSPTKVDAYRWKAPELTRIWGVDEADGVESIVTVGREVYVRHGGAVARFELGRRLPTWERASGFRGRLAVRGDRVYALDYPSGANGELVSLSRAQGTVVDRAETGHNQSGAPKPGDDVRIAVGARRVFVRHADPIATTDGGANVSEFPLLDGKPGAVRLHDCLGEATECDKGWLALHREGAAARLVFDEDGKDIGHLLAESGRRSEFAAKPLCASFARAVTLIGGAAVDLETGRVLWRSGRDAGSRLVPARDAVLVAEPGGRLAALREARGGPAAPRIAAAQTAPFAGRAALGDGSVVAGTFTLDAAARTIAVDGKPPRVIPLADVLVVEDAGGALVCAGPGADDVRRGLEALLDRERADGWRDIAKLVAGSRDEALLRRVVTEGWVHGCRSEDLADAEAHLRDLSQPGKSGKEDPALAQKVADAEARLARRSAESALAHAKSLPAAAPTSLQVDLLRVVLALDPTNADAAARVRAVVPADVAAAPGFSAADWLDFADAVLACPVTIMPPPRADAPDLTQLQRTYGSLLYSWRRDLVAFRSERLVLITPIARPGAIARCLSMGELVCASLEKLFEGAPSRRKSTEPLVLTLVDSLKILEQTAGSRRPGDADFLTWGRYLPEEERSVVFLPDEDDGFRAAAPVFAYLLAQQWMDQRCPAFTLADCRAAYGTRPQFWLEYGFPKLFGELRWDLRRRTWTRDPRSETPGFLAHVPPGAAAPWPRLVSVTGEQYWGLDQKPKVDMVVPDRLGWHQGVSDMMLFDFQSSALCQYLFFADDGKLRAKLLEFLGAYYRGEKPDFAATFGADPAAAGERAVKFAVDGR